MTPTEYSNILKFADLGISLLVIFIFVKWISILYGDIKSITKENHEVMDRVHKSLDMLTSAIISSNPHIDRGNDNDRHE